MAFEVRQASRDGRVRRRWESKIKGAHLSRAKRLSAHRNFQAVEGQALSVRRQTLKQNNASSSAVVS